MKILETNVMRGPNYWSVFRHKLIVMKLDIEEMENHPTNKIEGFSERLEKMFPSMYEHFCSENKEGGFFLRVKEGTWMGHVIEHIALEIQKLAGMDVKFGRTRNTGEKGIYYVVFSYMEEEAGLFAAKSAVKIAQSLIDGEDYDLEADLQEMREIREEERLGPSTGSIVEEAQNRGIPSVRLNRSSLVMLGYGINQKRVQATITSTTSNIAVDIACNKEETKYLLEKANIPTPKGRIVSTVNQLKNAIVSLGFPLVIKPINGNHGKGATINIKKSQEAYDAFDAAQKYSKTVIVEKFIEGFDFRLLVINYKLVAAAKRTPAHVVGDGKSTIQTLIDVTNSDPRRGYAHEKSLTAIKIESMSLNILKEKEFSLDSILPNGEILYLKSTANLSTGGTATDVTDMVHPSNVFLAERIARIIGLDICGIDIMATNLTVPIEENGGVVLEVNAAPGFRMHIAPTNGLPRNVAAPVIDMLFPPGANSTIPIIAVTGTNGKTTTTRLIAHMVKAVGYKVGYTTSEGIYIQNRLLEEGDCTGPQSAEFVLKDPTVDFAVLECARGGILRAGLGFSKCDVGIVTNISEDHLGDKFIENLEDMAAVKAVVPESVSTKGYAILNADDDLVYNMNKNLDCQIAYFSLNEDNPRIKKHCERGGIAAFIENGYVTISKGTWKIRIEKIINIPLTFSGKAMFMLENILPAVLAGFVRDFKVEDIRVALNTFIPAPTQNPGKMNHFQFRNFIVMVDSAHNTAGLAAMGKYLELIPENPKTGVMGVPLNRRKEDIIHMGRIAAQIFDELIIKESPKGDNISDQADWLIQGILMEKPGMTINRIANEEQAISQAVENAPVGSFIVICSESPQETIEIIKKYKEEEDQFLLMKQEFDLQY
ncbi:MAG: cyanophycin synthetase [Bacteroidetes bacterium]|nr:cyanophycin synthetase [Bacteroidota bacterium]HET6244890.1 cyanophycin synthetase [Bacteroidia bacterium]